MSKKKQTEETPLCKDCGKSVEGTAYQVLCAPGEKTEYRHKKCAPGERSRTPIFPFTTTHIANGQPVEVQSLHHLRKLEREHGVASEAFNNDSTNW